MLGAKESGKQRKATESEKTKRRVGEQIAGKIDIFSCDDFGVLKRIIRQQVA
jgi:hypothetical protein